MHVLGLMERWSRDNHGVVFLMRYLRPALQQLNPALPAEAIELAIVD